MENFCVSTNFPVHRRVLCFYHIADVDIVVAVVHAQIVVCRWLARAVIINPVNRQASRIRGVKPHNEHEVP